MVLLHKRIDNNTIFIISLPLLIRFMVNYDIHRDSNIFLSLPNEAIPLKVKVQVTQISKIFYYLHNLLLFISNDRLRSTFSKIPLRMAIFSI